MRSMLVAGTLLLAAVVPLGGAFHSDHLPVVLSASSGSSGAWGVRVTNAGPGDIALDLMGTGPASASQLSGGAFVLDAAGNVQFGFAFTAHLSPDRLVLIDAVQGTMPHNLAITFRGEGQGASADSPCTYFCLGLGFTGATSANMVAWMGGVTTTTLEVRTANGAAQAKAGTAHVLGDAELTNGSPNIQVQQGAGLPTGSPGVKLILDASAQVGVQDKLYGFWGASDFKLACVFAAGLCVWKSSLDPAILSVCAIAGVNCSLAAISWDGPGGIGGSGSSIYGYLGLGPGSYSFNVDRKVDAYNTNGIFVPGPGVFVLVAENYSFLTVADAALP